MPSSVINSDDGVISGTSGLKSSGGDDGVLVFQSKGTETARINTTGSVAIGTTSTAGADRLTLKGSTTDSSTNFLVRDSGDTTRLSVANDGTFKMDSGYGSAATAYGCRAWVNFNGTGTPAIREDGGVSSITDNATGSFGINFTTAMPDANFAAICVAGNVNTGAQQFPISTMDNYSTTSVNLIVRQADNDNNTFVAADYEKNDVAIFR
jgi:hypothetical protein